MPPIHVKGDQPFNPLGKGDRREFKRSHSWPWRSLAIQRGFIRLAAGCRIVGDLRWPAQATVSPISASLSNLDLVSPVFRWAER